MDINKKNSSVQVYPWFFQKSILGKSYSDSQSSGLESLFVKLTPTECHRGEVPFPVRGGQQGLRTASHSHRSSHRPHPMLDQFPESSWSVLDGGSASSFPGTVQDVAELSTAMTKFGQTKFGQIHVWPDQVWPRPSLARPSLARTKFGQTKFGQDQVWPNHCVLLLLCVCVVVVVLLCCCCCCPNPKPWTLDPTKPWTLKT